MLAVLEDAAARGGTLYDVGGHVGFFACAWFRLGGAFVEVFEPVPSSVDRIRKTLREKRHGLRSHGSTLSPSPTTTESHAGLERRHLGLVSMSYLDNCGGTPKIRRQTGNVRLTVRVATLDYLRREIDLQGPDLIKIDVEGAEGEVVRGMPETIARFQPRLITELHGVRCGVEVTATLSGLGYIPTPVGNRDAGMPIFSWRHGVR